MKRRAFITLLGGAAAVLPLAARAQQLSLPVIGYLGQLSPEASTAALDAFKKGLGEAGFVEGRNVAFEYRWGHDNVNRLPELAAELVRLKVTVIAAVSSTRAPMAAKAATTTIPIVFTTAFDPVDVGLVPSINRPGGNLTGVTDMSSELVSKRIGLVHELIPGASHFGLLFNPSTPGPSTETYIKDAQAAAAAIQGRVEVYYAGTTRDIEMTFANLAQKRIDVLLVPTNPLFSTSRFQIVALAARHAMPVVFPERAGAEAGGLVSYGSSSFERNRQAGIYTGRVLKGEKPADLPVLRPTKYELVINLKTAKALGLTVPLTLRVAADEVIE